MSETPILNEAQQRVLGCLIEKAETTPDQYPLTLNAIRLACNQKTNREPLTDYSDSFVRDTLRTLENNFIVRQRSPSDSRVPKWEHNAAKIFDITTKDLAPLCVMLLRGPQTLGELRIRCERLYNFPDLAEIERTLERLANRTPQPYVVKLPRLAGQKEFRYAHLLGGPVDIEALAAASHHSSESSSSSASHSRIEHLETEVASLRRQVDDLNERLSKLEAALS